MTSSETSTSREPWEPALDAAWEALERDELERVLGTGPRGLTPEEASVRASTVGPNVIAEAEPTTVWTILAHQFRSPLVYILLIAGVVTLAIGEYIDSAVIFAVLVLNATIGFFQENKADRAVRSLMGLVAPRAHIVRAGEHMVVESADLVPGDLVVLESGQRVPADLRLVETTVLSVDESLLTGESLTSAKSPGPLEAGLATADRVNMAFSGTVVTSGRGRGYVVETGPQTELGKIASQIRGEREQATPLQQRMSRFARVVGVVVVVAAGLSLLLATWRGATASEAFLVAVALAVSAIPEGLPVVMTITLAVGVQRMARRNAVIRRLPAVETLGSITAIGSDKTGTLTLNRMTVLELWTTDGVLEVESDGQLTDPQRMTLVAGVLANEAAESTPDDDGEEGSTGDPTEIALLVSARRLGVDPRSERDRWSSWGEIPFEPEHRYSASFRNDGDTRAVFVKGAPERVLELCDRIATPGGVEDIDIAAVEEAAADMASRGMRVLAMAYAPDPSGSPEDGDPDGLTLLGLQGMIDPPRPGVPEAIESCQQSGIRVLMITGDHADTARSIASELGIAHAEAPVVTGADMELIDDEELKHRVGDVHVFARVSPEHKLRVVRALQAHDEVVAVTGDGANDAPALKAADVGVAMGRSGTDVAREASDMVLADDNFVSIVEAVKQGRVTFDNLRKVTFFLISSGFAEIVAIIFAVAAGWPLPMLPAQILWLNLVTNGLQDVALAFEPPEPGIERRRPRPRREGIISRLLWERTILSGLVMAAGTLVMFRWVLDSSGSLVQAQTVALTTMVVFQALHAGNSRSEKVSVFRISPFSNRILLLAVAGALVIHLIALRLPFTQFVLRVEPIEPGTWPLMLAIGLSVVVVVEADKWIRRRRENRS